MDIHAICQQFARILGGTPSVKQGVCLVEKARSPIGLRILGRPAQSVFTSMCSFESLDREGKALNLGETALLQQEVYPFTLHLQRNGIMVTALHNHWMFEQPPILYVHYASVEDPLSFAAKVAEAQRWLTVP